MTPFAVVPRFAVEQCHGPDMIALLTIIALNGSPDGWCHQSHAYLAVPLGRSRAWVSATMKELAELRVLILGDARPGQQRSCRLIYDEGVPLPRVTRQPADTPRQPADTPSSSSSSIEEPIDLKVKKKKKIARIKKTEVLLAETWRPDPDVWQWAHTYRPDLNHEDTLGDFRRYFIARGDARADWNGSFKNWVRREGPALRPVGGGDSGGTAKLGRDETRARLTDAAAQFLRGDRTG